jgi:hypothetical protein
MTMAFRFEMGREEFVGCNVCFTMHFYDSKIFIPTNAQFDFYL